MRDTFTAEFFSANRARLRKLFQGTAPIVITANGLLQKAGDETFKFQQDASFFYLTGIVDPDILLVIDKDKEYLILPEHNNYQDIFDGLTPVDELIKVSGIQEVLDNKQGWKKLTGKLKKAKHFATLAPLPAFVDSHGFYPNPTRAKLLEDIKQINSTIEPLDLRQHLSVMRMVKQPVEIDAIQKAIDITCETFKEIKRKLPKLNNEREIDALIAFGFSKRMADGLAYETIVGSGKNACTLHYRSNNAELKKNDLLLIDAGAEVAGYAADITRTYRISGSPSRAQQKIHDAVMEVRDYALSNLKPGITIRENEKLVEQFMGEKLRALGLIRNVEHDEIRKYYPHATSHFLGLDVHDAGDYDRPLEPGVILTVEPGIYIPEQGIGIRLEDDVLITEDGNKVMSAKLSLDL